MKSKGSKTRNPFEKKILEQLESLSTKKVLYEHLRLPYTTSHEYLSDFFIQGTNIIIEAKGGGRAWSPQVRRKMLDVRDQHPEYDIRFVFYSDRPFGAKRKDGTKMTQSEWCKKHGFKYAIGEVPKEWIV